MMLTDFYRHFDLNYEDFLTNVVMSDLMMKIVYAFSELQQQKIRHHDISLKNIMLTRDY